MDRHLWGLNPKLSEFLEQKDELTVIGLYWAGYWRLVVAVLGFYIAASCVSVGLSLIFS